MILDDFAVLSGRKRYSTSKFMLQTVNFLSMCALKHIKKLANLQKIAI